MMTESDYKNRCMTVVVPVYNRAHLVERSLDSIYAQTYRPIALIVVDNGSSDSTLPVVRDWAGRHEEDGFSVRILSDARRGAAYARQTGLEHTQTGNVMFFDSDDVLRPGAVADVMAEWDLHPDCDIVAWPVTVQHPHSPVTTHAITGNLLERHLVHTLFRTQGYAVKTSWIRECGGWKGEFPVWNDLETGLRLMLRKPEVLPLREPLADVYPQKESITGTDYSSKAGQWENTLDGMDRAISLGSHKSSGRLHHIVSYRRAILAAVYAKEGHPDLARPLYRRALSEVPAPKRPLLRFAYHWTRLGMRGAFSIVGKLL